MTRLNSRSENFHPPLLLFDEKFRIHPEGEPIQLVALLQLGAAQHLYETPLSDDQQFVDEDDGQVRLAATVNDTSSLRWWLLGFGGRVEVLEPAALREEMADTARRMAWRYRQEA